MDVPRIFVSYYPDKEQSLDLPLVQQLISDLRAAGAEVLVDGGRNTDDDFFQFITHELPTCQWVLFVQTAETLQEPRTRMTFSAAQKLLEQQSIQGLLRIIPAPTETTQAPAEWAELTTYNIAQDYPKAFEKLLFALSLGDTAGMQAVELANPALLPKRVSHFSSPPPTYDRPLALPPRMNKFRDMRYSIGRKGLTIGLIVLAIIIVAASTSALIVFFTPPPPPNPIVGYAYFTSSELFDDTGTKGANDGINVILNNLIAPKANNSYYAWLLPDSQQSEANTISIGKISSISNNIAQLTYTSPTHDNLLGLASRILITEESSSILPSNPSPDKGTWRYYAEIPQGNSSSQVSSSTTMDMSGASQVDHLRHLLYGDPNLQKLNIMGGSAFWFHQNTQKVMLWSKEARESGLGNITQLDAIKILDYIDGAKYVQGDVPTGTVLQVDSKVAQMALLTLDPEHESPQGYVNYMSVHLNGLVNAPGATPQEKSQIIQINTALNNIEVLLTQVRQDAVKIVNHTADASTLEDMYMQSNDMYYGHYDPASGNRQGGAIWIYDHIQHLSLFIIKKYGA